MRVKGASVQRDVRCSEADTAIEKRIEGETTKGWKEA